MNDQILAEAFKTEALAIAAGDSEFAKLQLLAGLTKEKRSTPALTFVASSDRVFRGKAGFFTVLMQIESAAADGEATHRDRVNLVGDLFLVSKAFRIAAINARAAVKISDYGQVPGKSEATHAEDGAKLKTTLTIKVCAQIPAPVV